MADVAIAGGQKRGADEEVEKVENGSKKARNSGEEELELSPEAGTLIFGGGTNYDLLGRKAPNKNYKPPPKGVNVTNLYGPHVWKEKIRVRSVASSSISCHAALITEDGKVMTWGRNENGQLGHGDNTTRYAPTLVKELEKFNIVQVATGRSHTLFLTDKGVVYACGSNQLAQLGLGTEGPDKLIPEKIDFSGKPIIRMSCGNDFSMIVDIVGGLHSFGSPEHGQLGHCSDGKFLERAGKYSFTSEKSPRQIRNFVEKQGNRVTQLDGISIKDVKCGTNHTVALDEKGRVYTWGFAGYGRLGHSDTKDEMCPRLIKQLELLKCVVTKIAAGTSFCLATATNNNLYFWGQTKSAGEATTYPKPVQDLCGWNIKSMACANKSIVVAADSAVISWGPSPTCGELMYGEGAEKSSTTAKEVKHLDGIQVKEVACGFGFTLLIAQDLTAEERQRIAKLPTW